MCANTDWTQGTSFLPVALASLPGVLVAVIGWYVTQRNNLRAQSRVFINQLTNDARGQLVESIRGYTDLLSKLYAKYHSAIADPPLAGVVRRFRGEVTSIIYDPAGFDWLFRLEEYELLYVETRNVRRQLSARHSAIQDEMLKFVQDCEAAASAGKLLSYTEQEIRRRGSVIMDQIALFHDLAIYIQNKALGSILNQTVPERTREGPGAQIRLGADGQLQIINSTTRAS